MQLNSSHQQRLSQLQCGYENFPYTDHPCEEKIKRLLETGLDFSSKKHLFGVQHGANLHEAQLQHWIITMPTKHIS